MDTVEAVFYAQIVGTKSWPHGPINGERIERVTQSKPTRPVSGAIVVRLRVRMPRSLFLPIEPEAVVEIVESRDAVVEAGHDWVAAAPEAEEVVEP